jgi:hypothetical protein
MGAYPTPDYRKIVRNQSSRNGQRILLMVIHSTEGTNAPGVSDLVALGGWFDNAASHVSSHGAVDAAGNSARYVEDDRKAWTCAAFNGRSLNLEIIAKAAFSREWWLSHRRGLREAARWLALWNKRHGVPLRKGAVSGRVVTRTGIVRHSELGAAGGGHRDPGPGFPLAYVLEKARYYRSLM